MAVTDIGLYYCYNFWSSIHRRLRIPLGNLNALKRKLSTIVLTNYELRLEYSSFFVDTGKTSN